MDLLAELESMALNITDTEDEVSAADTERWQQLFGFTQAEAIQSTEHFWNGYSRTRVSDELWATVGSTKEAEGYDREAYEYSDLSTPRIGLRLNRKFWYFHRKVGWSPRFA